MQGLALLLVVFQRSLALQPCAQGCAHLFRVRHFGAPWPQARRAADAEPRNSSSSSSSSSSSPDRPDETLVAGFNVAGSGLLEVRLGEDVAQRIAEHGRGTARHGGGVRHGVRKRTEAFVYRYLRERGRASRLKVFFTAATDATALAQAVLLLAEGGHAGGGASRGATAVAADAGPLTVVALADGFSLCAQVERGLWALAQQRGLTRLVLMSSPRQPLGTAAALNALLLGGLLPGASLLAVLPRNYVASVAAAGAAAAGDGGHAQTTLGKGAAVAPRDLFVQAEHVLRCYREPQLALFARLRIARHSVGGEGAVGTAGSSAQARPPPPPPLLLLLLTPAAARRVGAFDVGAGGGAASEGAACDASADASARAAVEDWLARAHAARAAVHDASLARYARRVPCRARAQGGHEGGGQQQQQQQQQRQQHSSPPAGVGVVLALRSGDDSSARAAVLVALLGDVAAAMGAGGVAQLQPSALIVLSTNRSLSAEVARGAEAATAARGVRSPWKLLEAAVGAGTAWLHGAWASVEEQRAYGEQLLRSLPPGPAHVLHLGLREAGAAGMGAPMKGVKVEAEVRVLHPAATSGGGGGGGSSSGGSGAGGVSAVRYAQLLPPPLRRLYGGPLLPAAVELLPRRVRSDVLGEEEEAADRNRDRDHNDNDNSDDACVEGLHIEPECIVPAAGGAVDEEEKQEEAAAAANAAVRAAAANARLAARPAPLPRIQVLIVGDGNVDEFSPNSASVVFRDVAAAVCGGLRELGHACTVTPCEDLRACGGVIDGCATGGGRGGCGDGGSGGSGGDGCGGCRLLLLGVHNLPNYHAADGGLAAHALLPRGTVLYNFETLNRNGSVSFHYRKPAAPMIPLYVHRSGGSGGGGGEGGEGGGGGAPHYRLWDYSRDNVEVLGALGVRGVQHVPIGYVDSLTQPWGEKLEGDNEEEEEEEDIDVLFYGSCNGYRARLLAELRAAGLRVLLANPDGDVVAGAVLAALVRRAKIVLNLRYHGGGGRSEWKMTRLLPLLANRRFVISELCGHAEEQATFAAGLVFAHDAADIARQAAHYLARPVERKRVAEAGFQIVRRLHAADMMRAAVSELMADN